MAAVGTAGQEGGRRQRRRWANRLEFLLVSSVYGVGMHNATSLPMLTLRNGGVCFLLVYALMFMLLALPLVFLEVSLGQATSGGCLSSWSRTPILRGAGLASLVVTSLLSLYHSALLATCAHFLFASFEGTQPWAPCQDGGRCPPGNSSAVGGSLGDPPVVQLLTGQSLGHRYWSDTVWNASYGFATPGGTNAKLAGCLLLVWLCTFAAIAGGIHVLGKVKYVTSTVPHLLFLALILGMGLQDGALLGIEEFLAPDVSVFAYYDLWTVAGREALHSVGISWGVHITMGSFNHYNTNFYRDSILVLLANMVSSLAPGMVLSAGLGLLASRWSLEVSELARSSGSEILFVTFPAATALMPASQVWAALFYLALFLQGISTQFCLGLTLATAIFDKYQGLARLRTVLVVALLTFAGFLLSLLLVTRGGLQWIVFLDYYTLLVSVPFQAAVLWVGLLLIYGYSSFCRDVRAMLNRDVPWFFKICLLSVTPLLILFVLGDTLVTLRLLHHMEPGFPAWADVLGVPLAFLAPACVLAYAVYALVFKHSGSLRARLCEATAAKRMLPNPFSTDEVAHVDTRETAHVDTRETAHVDTRETAHVDTDETEV
ncbi:sodium- and chloride-dependent glycine transporter 1-like isoform X2 [Petromyzon marinus]|uniref:Sodium- and chloride-dependent glycine transporter 1-like n=1 Tax=Petromyzon marinus TaxID=7757 RepID=A0AAJ7T1B1_PETMA|nr:sodium- and chloride-dependent glycine transporter 1-like [Petromyzon marinus]